MESVEKGTRAKALLADPLIQEAFTDIREALIHQWEASSDTSARDECWYTLKGLERLKTVLEVTVDNAEFDSRMQENANE